MTQFHIYQATEVGKRFTETEIQPREYAGYVNASTLEEAFRLAQNGNHAWDCYETRSTSVGDVIQSDEGFYMVCGTGFKLLDETSKNDSELNGIENESLEQ